MDWRQLGMTFALIGCPSQGAGSARLMDKAAGAALCFSRRAAPFHKYE